MAACQTRRLTSISHAKIGDCEQSKSPSSAERHNYAKLTERLSIENISLFETVEILSKGMVERETC